MNIYVCGWNAGATWPDYGCSSASVLRLGEVDPSQLLKECDSLLRDAGLEG